MSLPSCLEITKTRLAREKGEKMTTILRNLEKLGQNFALHSGTIQDMCLQNIIGISVKMRALGPGKRFEHTLWIILGGGGGFKPIQHIHVGPN